MTTKPETHTVYYFVCAHDDTSYSGAREEDWSDVTNFSTCPLCAVEAIATDWEEVDDE